MCPSAHEAEASCLDACRGGAARLRLSWRDRLWIAARWTLGLAGAVVVLWIGTAFLAASPAAAATAVPVSSQAGLMKGGVTRPAGGSSSSGSSDGDSGKKKDKGSDKKKDKGSDKKKDESSDKKKSESSDKKKSESSDKKKSESSDKKKSESSDKKKSESSDKKKSESSDKKKSESSDKKKEGSEKDSDKRDERAAAKKDERSGEKGSESEKGADVEDGGSGEKDARSDGKEKDERPADKDSEKKGSKDEGSKDEDEGSDESASRSETAGSSDSRDDSDAGDESVREKPDATEPASEDADERDADRKPGSSEGKDDDATADRNDDRDADADERAAGREEDLAAAGSDDTDSRPTDAEPAGKPDDSDRPSTAGSDVDGSDPDGTDPDGSEENSAGYSAPRHRDDAESDDTSDGIEGGSGSGTEHGAGGDRDTNGDTDSNGDASDTVANIGSGRGTDGDTEPGDGSAGDRKTDPVAASDVERGEDSSRGRRDRDERSDEETRGDGAGDGEDRVRAVRDDARAADADDEIAAGSAGDADDATADDATAGATAEGDDATERGAATDGTADRDDSMRRFATRTAVAGAADDDGADVSEKQRDDTDGSAAGDDDGSAAGDEDGSARSDEDGSVGGDVSDVATVRAARDGESAAADRTPTGSIRSAELTDTDSRAPPSDSDTGQVSLLRASEDTDADDQRADCDDDCDDEIRADEIRADRSLAAADRDDEDRRDDDEDADDSDDSDSAEHTEQVLEDRLEVDKSADALEKTKKKVESGAARKVDYDKQSAEHKKREQDYASERSELSDDRADLIDEVVDGHRELSDREQELAAAGKDASADEDHDKPRDRDVAEYQERRDDVYEATDELMDATDNKIDTASEDDLDGEGSASGCGSSGAFTGCGTATEDDEGNRDSDRCLSLSGGCSASSKSGDSEASASCDGSGCGSSASGRGDRGEVTRASARCTGECDEQSRAAPDGASADCASSGGSCTSDSSGERDDDAVPDRAAQAVSADDRELGSSRGAGSGTARCQGGDCATSTSVELDEEGEARSVANVDCGRGCTGSANTHTDAAGDGGARTAAATQPTTEQAAGESAAGDSATSGSARCTAAGGDCTARSESRADTDDEGATGTSATTAEVGCADAECRGSGAAETNGRIIGVAAVTGGPTPSRDTSASSTCQATAGGCAATSGSEVGESDADRATERAVDGAIPTRELFASSTADAQVACVDARCAGGGQTTTSGAAAGDVPGVRSSTGSSDCAVHGAGGGCGAASDTSVSDREPVSERAAVTGPVSVSTTSASVTCSGGAGTCGGTTSSATSARDTAVSPHARGTSATADCTVSGGGCGGETSSAASSAADFVVTDPATGLPVAGQPTSGPSSTSSASAALDCPAGCSGAAHTSSAAWDGAVAGGKPRTSTGTASCTGGTGGCQVQSVSSASTGPGAAQALAAQSQSGQGQPLNAARLVAGPSAASAAGAALTCEGQAVCTGKVTSAVTATDPSVSPDPRGSHSEGSCEGVSGGVCQAVTNSAASSGPDANSIAPLVQARSTENATVTSGTTGEAPAPDQQAPADGQDQPATLPAPTAPGSSASSGAPTVPGASSWTMVDATLDCGASTTCSGTTRTSASGGEGPATANGMGGSRGPPSGTSSTSASCAGGQSGCRAQSSSTAGSGQVVADIVAEQNKSAAQQAAQQARQIGQQAAELARVAARPGATAEQKKQAADAAELAQQAGQAAQQAADVAAEPVTDAPASMAQSSAQAQCSGPGCTATTTGDTSGVPGDSHTAGTCTGGQSGCVSASEAVTSTGRDSGQKDADGKPIPGISGSGQATSQIGCPEAGCTGTVSGNSGAVAGPNGQQSRSTATGESRCDGTTECSAQTTAGSSVSASAADLKRDAQFGSTSASVTATCDNGTATGCATKASSTTEVDAAEKVHATSSAVCATAGGCQAVTSGSVAKSFAEVNAMCGGTGCRTHTEGAAEAVSPAGKNTATSRSDCTAGANGTCAGTTQVAANDAYALAGAACSGSEGSTCHRAESHASAPGAKADAVGVQEGRTGAVHVVTSATASGQDGFAQAAASCQGSAGISCTHHWDVRVSDFASADGSYAIARAHDSGGGAMGAGGGWVMAQADAGPWGANATVACSNEAHCDKYYEAGTSIDVSWIVQEQTYTDDEVTAFGVKKGTCSGTTGNGCGVLRTSGDLQCTGDCSNYHESTTELYRAVTALAGCKTDGTHCAGAGGAGTVGMTPEELEKLGKEESGATAVVDEDGNVTLVIKVRGEDKPRTCDDACVDKLDTDSNGRKVWGDESGPMATYDTDVDPRDPRSRLTASDRVGDDDSRRHEVTGEYKAQISQDEDYDTQVWWGGRGSVKDGYTGVRVNVDSSTPKGENTLRIVDRPRLPFDGEINGKVVGYQGPHIDLPPNVEKLNPDAPGFDTLTTYGNKVTFHVNKAGQPLIDFEGKGDFTSAEGDVVHAEGDGEVQAGLDPDHMTRMVLRDATGGNGAYNVEFGQTGSVKTIEGWGFEQTESSRVEVGPEKERWAQVSNGQIRVKYRDSWTEGDKNGIWVVTPDANGKGGFMECTGICTPTRPAGMHQTDGCKVRCNFEMELPTGHGENPHGSTSVTLLESGGIIVTDQFGNKGDCTGTCNIVQRNGPGGGTVCRLAATCGLNNIQNHTSGCTAKEGNTCGSYLLHPNGERNIGRGCDPGGGTCSGTGAPDRGWITDNRDGSLNLLTDLERSRPEMDTEADKTLREKCNATPECKDDPRFKDGRLPLLDHQSYEALNPEEKQEYDSKLGLSDRDKGLSILTMGSYSSDRQYDLEKVDEMAPELKNAVDKIDTAREGGLTQTEIDGLKPEFDLVQKANDLATNFGIVSRTLDAARESYGPELINGARPSTEATQKHLLENQPELVRRLGEVSGNKNPTWQSEMDALGDVTGVPDGLDPATGLPLGPDGKVPRDPTLSEANAAAAKSSAARIFQLSTVAVQNDLDLRRKANNDLAIELNACRCGTKADWAGIEEERAGFTATDKRIKAFNGVTEQLVPTPGPKLTDGEKAAREKKLREYDLVFADFSGDPEMARRMRSMYGLQDQAAALATAMENSGDKRQQEQLAPMFKTLSGVAALGYNTAANDTVSRSPDNELRDLRMPNTGTPDLYFAMNSAQNRAGWEKHGCGEDGYFCSMGAPGETPRGATVADRRAQFAAEGTPEQVEAKLGREINLGADWRAGIAEQLPGHATDVIAALEDHVGKDGTVSYRNYRVQDKDGNWRWDAAYIGSPHDGETLIFDASGAYFDDIADMQENTEMYTEDEKMTIIADFTSAGATKVVTQQAKHVPGWKKWGGRVLLVAGVIAGVALVATGFGAVPGASLIGGVATVATGVSIAGGLALGGYNQIQRGLHGQSLTSEAAVGDWINMAASALVIGGGATRIASNWGKAAGAGGGFFRTVGTASNFFGKAGSIKGSIGAGAELLGGATMGVHWAAETWNAAQSYGQLGAHGQEDFWWNTIGGGAATVVGVAGAGRAIHNRIQVRSGAVPSGLTVQRQAPGLPGRTPVTPGVLPALPVGNGARPTGGFGGSERPAGGAGVEAQGGRPVVEESGQRGPTRQEVSDVLDRAGWPEAVRDGELAVDKVEQLADPVVYREVQATVHAQEAGRVRGMDDWLKFNAGKAPDELREAALELGDARQLEIDNPGAVVRVGRENNAPVRAGTEERMQEFDLSVETPAGEVTRVIEVTVLDKPLTRAPQLTNKVRHAADKVAGRQRDGEPVEGSPEALVHVRLPEGTTGANRKGGSLEIREDGTMIRRQADGTLIPPKEGHELPNLFKDIEKQLAASEANSNLDRVTLVTQYGKIVYVRHGETWTWERGTP